MRRLLIIFLLAILPLQAAMAAACAYCPDSCMVESASANVVDGSFDDTAAHDDCGQCPASSVGMIPSLCTSRLSSSPEKLSSPDNGSLIQSGKPDRPERPKWTRAA